MEEIFLKFRQLIRTEQQRDKGCRPRVWPASQIFPG
jgi:hypothetical protein